MGRFGVELLLVVFAALTVLGLLVTYTISVALDHVTPDLPYISDTGGKPPESCIFSLVCNVAILFELLIVWIRFKHIHTYHLDGVSGCLCSMKIINYTALLFGLLSAFGFLLVANFQNDTVPVVHFLGALIVFFSGLVYQWFQTHMSVLIYRSSLLKKGLVWIVLQVIISIFSALFFVGALTFAVLASKSRRIEENESGSFIWTPKDGGFAYHVVSTACEWGIGIFLLLFFLTFHPDFKRIRLEASVRLRSEPRLSQSQYGSMINESTPLTI